MGHRGPRPCRSPAGVRRADEGGQRSGQLDILQQRLSPHSLPLLPNLGLRLAGSGRGGNRRLGDSGPSRPLRDGHTTRTTHHLEDEGDGAAHAHGFIEAQLQVLGRSRGRGGMAAPAAGAQLLSEARVPVLHAGAPGPETAPSSSHLLQAQHGALLLPCRPDLPQILLPHRLAPLPPSDSGTQVHILLPRPPGPAPLTS